MLSSKHDVALLVALLLVCAPGVAAASEGETDQGSAAAVPHSLRIGATLAGASLKGTSAYRPYASGGFVQLGVSYRVSRFFAVGGVASTTYADDGEQAFSRVTGEARFLPLTSRFLDIWGAAELGLAASTYVPSGCGDCGPIRDADLRTHFAPIFGPGAGVDFLPIKSLSIGVEGRMLVPIYAAAPVAEGPTGVAPVFMFGFTLAAHLARE